MQTAKGEIALLLAKWKDGKPPTLTHLMGGGYDLVSRNDDFVWVGIGSPEMLELNHALGEVGARCLRRPTRAGF